MSQADVKETEHSDPLIVKEGQDEERPRYEVARADARQARTSETESTSVENSKATTHGEHINRSVHALVRCFVCICAT